MIIRPLTPETMKALSEATRSGDHQALMRAAIPVRDSQATREWAKFDEALEGQHVSADLCPWPCIVEVDEDTLALAGYKPWGNDPSEVSSFKGRYAALIKAKGTVRHDLMHGDYTDRSRHLNDKGVEVIKVEGPFTGRGWINKMADFCRS